MSDKNKRLDLSYSQIRGESIFKKILIVVSALIVLIVAGILVTLIVESWPSIKAYGVKFLWGRTWDPVSDVYGALPFLIGTLLTSFTALIISIPFSYAIAIYLGEELYVKRINGSDTEETVEQEIVMTESKASEIMETA